MCEYANRVKEYEEFPEDKDQKNWCYLPHDLLADEFHKVNIVHPEGEITATYVEGEDGNLTLTDGGTKSECYSLKPGGRGRGNQGHDEWPRLQRGRGQGRGYQPRGGQGRGGYQPRGGQQGQGAYQQRGAFQQRGRARTRRASWARGSAEPSRGYREPRYEVEAPSYAPKPKPKPIVKVPIPMGETGAKRAQAALNQLYISFCIRNSRDHVRKIYRSAPFSNLNPSLINFAEERQDHPNDLSNGQDRHGPGMAAPAPASPETTEQATFRLANGVILTTSCDKNETDCTNDLFHISKISNKTNILIKCKPIKRSLSQDNSARKSCTLKNPRSKQPQPLHSRRAPPEAKTNSIASFLKSSRIHSTSAITLKESSNPLRISSEDPEIYFSNN